MQDRATPAPTGALRTVIEQLEWRVVLSVAAPTGFDATLAAPRSAVVEWTDVDGETGYVIERRVDGTTEPWTRVGDTAANVTRFAQDGLAAGKTYLYRVRARQGDASSEPSNVDSVTTPAEPAVPAAPRLEFLLQGGGVVKLQWSNVANETGYTVERRVDGTTVPFQPIATLDADTTTVNDQGLQAGRTYLYRVRAFNAQGSSAFSNTAVVTLPGAGVPAAPRELVAEVVQGAFVRLRWVDVANEKGYKIERRLDGSGSGEWVQVGTTAENVVTFADQQVRAGRRYVYRVRAFNEAGNSAYSNTAAVTVPGETGAPAAPRELNAELAGELRVKITWNDVADEKGYKVERRLDGTDAWTQIGTTAPNVTTFVDERVDAGRTYIYRVRAFNEAGDSSYSNTDAVTLPAGPAVPLAPRLEVDLVAPRAARLRWTNVTNETGYRVERRVDGTDAWQLIRTVGPDVTTITDGGLEVGKAYLYRVRAFNAAGNSPYSNVGVARVKRAGLPTAPRELRATAVSATKVELRWVDSSGEAGYRIERRVLGTDHYEKIGTAPANATTFTDPTVTAGTSYQYRVRAFNEVGNSPYSNVATVKAGDEGTRPAVPRLEAAPAGPRAAKLTWTDVAGEAVYRVERRVDGSADGWRAVRTVNAGVTTITDDGLEAGKTYLYRVFAVNAAGDSPASNVAVVRTAGEVTRPAAPRDLRAEAASATRIVLHWVGVDGETGYRVERRVLGTDTWEKVGLVATDVTSFSDAAVVPGKAYQYRVRATGPGEPSEWSNVASATTPEVAANAAATTAATPFSSRRIAP
jgi:fibronectin type 3 domain-containing protein